MESQLAERGRNASATDRVRSYYCIAQGIEEINGSPEPQASSFQCELTRWIQSCKMDFLSLVLTLQSAGCQHRAGKKGV